MTDEKRIEFGQGMIKLLNGHFALRCECSPELLDAPLTGQPFALDGKELYQFLMLVEETYGVYFQPDDIRRHGFHTINEVIDLVGENSCGLV